jgi:uncharacterized protein (DUF1697 family)
VTRYAALIRGINVGGRAKVKMDDLRNVFAALGHGDITTYIQSGNVVFSTAPRSAPKVAAAIEDRIREDLGLGVTVLLRTDQELGDVIAANPFLAGGADPARLHATFLVDTPAPERLDHVAVPDSGPDEFAIVGREVYLHCPEGYGRTKLNNTLWERRLGVAATTRNWNTVVKLHELGGP